MKSVISQRGGVCGSQLAVLAASLFAFASFPAAAQGDNEAKFCTGKDSTGSCFTVRKGGGSTDLSKRNMDNSISSVSVGKTVAVIAFDSTNRTGACVRFEGSSGGGSGSYANLDNYQMNDGLSSNDCITSYQVGPTTYRCR